MTEQTKLELLKIAASLTIAYAGSGGASDENVKKHFEHFCFYLVDNFDKLGVEKNITNPASG